MSVVSAFFVRASRLLSAWLIATGLAWAAQQTGVSSREGQASDAALREVFGVPRNAAEDALFLNDGTRVTGTILNDALSLRAPYGLLKFAATNLAGVKAAGTVQPFALVVTIDGGQFSGFIEDPAWMIKLADGATNQFRREKLLAAVFQIRPDEGRPDAPQFFKLRNGDHFAGRLRGDSLAQVFGSASTGSKPDDVAFVQFLDGPRPRIRIGLQSGQTLTGTWPGEDLDIEADHAGTLKLYWGYLDRIEFGAKTVRTAPGDTPPVIAAAANVPPDGRQIPGLAWIPPGRFVMGSPVEETDRDLDEGPQTEVTLTRGFWMGVCEVTQAEYKALMETNPSRFLGDPQLPVERVTWREAMDFCARLNQRHAADGTLPRGYLYRLPTEAEWEYACRAGTTSRFSFGDDPTGLLLPGYAWFGDNSDSAPHPIGTKTANAWGLHDLHGNVLEWCLDAATGSLPGGRVTDYRAPESGSLRIARGGSWLYGAKACRSANRDSYGETTRCSDVGFRVVLAPTGE